MKRVLLCWLMLATLSFPADKKRKGPELEILEVNVKRVEETLAVDGRVRNSGEKPIERLTLVVHVNAPGHQLITTQRGTVEEDVLAPRAEAEFHLQLPTPPRAVEVNIEAVDRGERELRVDKTGPYAIE